ncbi:MAG: motility associated factor glycosyltransferase family protein [Spirochaetaceae bacterium]
MTLLEANLATLREHAPELATLLDGATPPPELHVEEARSGAPTARYGGHYLHSRHDPIHEAQRIAERLAATGADGFVVYGFGLGYLPEAVIDASDGEPVVVVERDHRFIAAALVHRDLRRLVSSDALHLLIGPSSGELAALLSHRHLRRPVSVGLRSVTETHQDYYAELEQARRSYVSRQEVNRNTLRRFGRRWVRNLAANVHLLAEARGVAQLKGKLAGIPALVCAGGPSMDRVIPYAHPLHERCVIIAVDTAVKPLLRAGVEPDFIVVVDPQYWNTRHLDNLSLNHALVVGESSTHPRAFRALKRPVLFCSSLFPLGQYLEAARGAFGKLGAGGSVSTTAWDFARHIGAEPVFVAGLDLGYPGYRTHVTGSLFEERSHMISTRLTTAETQQVAYIEGGQPYWTNANDDGAVLTDRRMEIYRDWFALQQDRKPRSVNLSIGGARIADIPPGDVTDTLSLPPRREEIDRALGNAILEAGGTEETPSGRTAWTTAPETERLRDAARRLTADLMKARELAEEAIAAVKVYTPGADPRHGASGHLRRGAPAGRPVRPLEEVEQDLRSLGSKDVVGFLLEAVATDLEDARPETLEEALGNSVRLYTAILESSNFHIAMLERAVEVLDARL